MSGLVKFILVVLAILAVHYFLWKKVCKDWLGHLTGIKRIMLIIVNLIIEGVVILLVGLYIFNGL